MIIKVLIDKEHYGDIDLKDFCFVTRKFSKRRGWPDKITDVVQLKNTMTLEELRIFIEKHKTFKN